MIAESRTAGTRRGAATAVSAAAGGVALHVVAGLAGGLAAGAEALGRVAAKGRLALLGPPVVLAPDGGLLGGDPGQAAAVGPAAAGGDDGAAAKVDEVGQQDG